MRKLIFAVSASALLTLGACVKVEDDTAPEATAAESSDAASGEADDGAMSEDLSIAENIAATSDLSSLNDAISSAGLGETMAGVGPYTLFAPNNAAFGSLPGAAEMVEAGGPPLVNLISYHIVPGVVTDEDLRNAIEQGDGSAELATMTGATLTVREQDGDLVISDGAGASSKVVGDDHAQVNGMIHVIDGVLQPE